MGELILPYKTEAGIVPGGRNRSRFFQEIEDNFF